jgi:N-methylhydantoinase A/oxoprolinase/acetone carboxylase beta subunit
MLERADLRDAAELSGPIIIFEPTATTYVDHGFRVRVDSSGALLIDQRAQT